MAIRRVTSCTTNEVFIIQDNNRATVGTTEYLQFSSSTVNISDGCYNIGTGTGATVADVGSLIRGFNSCEDCITRSPVKTATSCIDNSTYFIQSFNPSTLPIIKAISGLTQLFDSTTVYLTFSEGSVPNGCYYLTSGNIANRNLVSSVTTGFTLCVECIDYLFQISGCNNSNSYILTGIVEGSGTTPGSVVTFNTPKPVWTNSRGSVRTQCDSVAIGGFNGLNS
jgi:hypothetical protein